MAAVFCNFCYRKRFLSLKKKNEKGAFRIHGCILKDAKTLHGIMLPLLDIRWRNGGGGWTFKFITYFIKLPNKYTCVGTYVYFFAKALTVCINMGEILIIIHAPSPIIDFLDDIVLSTKCKYISWDETMIYIYCMYLLQDLIIDWL